MVLKIFIGKNKEGNFPIVVEKLMINQSRNFLLTITGKKMLLCF